MISKQNKYTIYAFNLGYRSKNGEVYSPYRKAPLKLNEQNGYLRFCIRYKDRVVPIYVHKLTAYQKYGQYIFDSGVEIRHRDGNSLNNSEDNILTGSHSDNIMDIPKNKRIAQSIKASSKIRKFTDDIITEIRDYYRECTSYKKTMEKFNIPSKGSLHYILNTKYKTNK